jgi:HSP20 family protein
MKLMNYNRPLPTNFFRFFDDQATRDREFNTGHRPAVNITETDAAFELALLAPGRAKDNFNVAFNEGTLEITYTTPTAAVTEGEDAPATPNYRRREFKLADFTRRFQLDDQVIDVEAIDASYTDGVLRLALPKREEVLPKAPRQIAVG